MGILIIGVLINLLTMHILAFQYASPPPTTSNNRDILALMAIKSQIQLPSNSSIGRSWSTNTSLCNWVGVSCSLRHQQRVIALNLSYMQLQGTISPHIGNLSFLRVLDLANNSFHGPIPNTLGRLRRLRVINLSRNQLQGDIPKGVGNLTSLEILSLQYNSLIGSIPRDLGCLSNLKFLNIGKNQLTGTIPASIELTGFQLPNLVGLMLQGNKFSGRIPDSISNASMLTLLELSTNSFSGPVPMTLGSLRYLTTLNLQNNELTNHPSQRELHFLTSLTQCRQLKNLVIGSNPLNGALPKSIGNLSTYLGLFNADASEIQGGLPYQVGNLSSLLSLELIGNELTGAIPSSVGNLGRLQKLHLRGNNLEGNLPNDLCGLTFLGELLLDENNLSGPIPSCIGNLTRMLSISLSSNAFTSIPVSMWSLSNVWSMNLSVNSLSGYLPPDIGKLAMLETLDLSNNQLSGSIPGTLSNLKMLKQLNLSDNAIQGNISVIGDLASLEFLDLSSNNLSGIIPKSLEELQYLKHLNLSFNMLSGQVPVDGSFKNFTIQSLMGNNDLCGNSKLKLPPCPHTTLPKQSRKVSFWLKYVLSPIAAVLLGIFLIFLYVKYWRKNKNLPVSSTDLSLKLGHKYISYYELLGATNNLSQDNLLGIGSFGSVYKGTMPDGDIVAAKVFDLQADGALTSFDKECQVLKSVRHRNLVKIISSCSNLDFRALVLEYMPNGSLEKWLYTDQGSNSCLDIVQRMDIMIDVASGLEYLHHGYSVPIVHCDLKPSNILLNEDMVAHVADFGIAKFLAKYKSMTQTATLGTIGYIAPEFGLQGRVSSKGDVYSYGVMLLETFTGKNPRDGMFVGGLSLRQWVISSYPDGVTEILDPRIWSSGGLGDGEADMVIMDSTKLCLCSIIDLALQCSSDLAEERPNMIDVAINLKKIKNRYSGTSR